jgi:hypothetical protein
MIRLMPRFFAVFGTMDGFLSTMHFGQPSIWEVFKSCLHMGHMEQRTDMASGRTPRLKATSTSRSPTMITLIFSGAIFRFASAVWEDNRSSPVTMMNKKASAIELMFLM